MYNASWLFVIYHLRGINKNPIGQGSFWRKGCFSADFSLPRVQFSLSPWRHKLQQHCFVADFKRFSFRIFLQFFVVARLLKWNCSWQIQIVHPLLVQKQWKLVCDLWWPWKSPFGLLLCNLLLPLLTGIINSSHDDILNTHSRGNDAESANSTTCSLDTQSLFVVVFAGALPSARLFMTATFQSLPCPPTRTTIFVQRQRWWLLL